ncbi:MAG TPA: hypothetical protein VKD68_05955 [Methyloceanibacter sp.]|nr:hypothetical protein [Methyloceanibacter sp.]
MAARKSTQPLYWVYLQRVIKIPAVQCHREAVTDDRMAQFFSEGCRPDTLDFQWFLDEPDLSFWEPASAISPILLQAWNAAFIAFLRLIDALAFGRLIATGVNPNTGTRCEIDSVEWMRTGLILDVRNGDLIEVSQGKRTVRWSAITLRAVTKRSSPTAKRGPSLVDWDLLMTYGVLVREAGCLPSKHASLTAKLKELAKFLFRVDADEADLRRLTRDIYAGRRKRRKRKRER